MTESEVVNPHIPLRRNLIQAYVQRFFPLVLFAVLFLVVSGLAVDLIRTKKSIKTGIQYTEDTIVNGGKRFIDFLYSLNSGTVKPDQYQAIKMMVDPEERSKRVDYLIKTDLIRSVEKAYQRSHIDWIKSSATILETTKTGFKVEYKAYLVIDSSQYYPLHLILDLVPMKATNENPTGVGVRHIKDVAEEPLF